jgi:hypothetical protein
MEGIKMNNKQFTFSFDKQPAYVFAAILLVVLGAFLRGWWDNKTPHTNSVSADHYVIVTPSVYDAGYDFKIQLDEEPVAHKVWIDGKLEPVGADGLHGLWGEEVFKHFAAEVWYMDGTRINYNVSVSKDNKGPFYPMIFRPTNVYHKVSISTWTDEHGSWYWSTNDIKEQIALTINLDGGALEENGQFSNNEAKNINLLVYFKDGGKVKCSFIIEPGQYQQELHCSDKDILPEDAAALKNPKDLAWFTRKVWIHLDPLFKAEIAVQGKFLENMVFALKNEQMKLENQRMALYTGQALAFDDSELPKQMELYSAWSSLENIAGRLFDTITFSLDNEQLRLNQLSPWVQAEEVQQMMLDQAPFGAILFGIFIFGLKLQVVAALLGCVVLAFDFLNRKVFTKGVWTF